ncbi:hypothetical protein [Roseospira visakhapatnamensis]|uniref:Uncharacterized small protein (DUF1192 family) n=1 Tax=Roseospira visakhapatnamensis TaxID=390880 RepID=A0A7W6RFC8_9PROT|nr:hypothetical protein [Roseospira visakhapatnamensis]MBB4267330.1 uncharacterized small protein (DUF1192 family) [Roseospira visakhapatnamensis]
MSQSVVNRPSSQPRDAVPVEDVDPPLYETFRARAEGTNINPETLLATDYLNHFNEIVMLLDMVPDMPDLVEECKAWQPKSYQAHFADSSFRDKDLAVEAYDHCPARYRRPFDATIEHMNQLALASVARMDEALAEGNTEVVRLKAQAASRALQRLMDAASAIIHGAQSTLHQDEIDAILDK